MTNKLVTFTSRFKAASSGAGAANWISMYAQSDHREFRTPWFGGTPWQANAPIDVYGEHSPLRDVSAVKTPTLFLVGEADPRVPMPQSVEMVRALESNGVPTRLWVAPREGHGWTELRHVLFRLQAELEWFDKWLNRQESVWESAPLAAPPPTPAPKHQRFSGIRQTISESSGISDRFCSLSFGERSGTTCLRKFSQTTGRGDFASALAAPTLWADGDLPCRVCPR
jgi:predicted acyl esterase